jgi:hypothetical protein
MLVFNLPSTQNHQTISAYLDSILSAHGQMVAAVVMMFEHFSRIINL